MNIRITLRSKGEPSKDQSMNVLIVLGPGIHLSVLMIGDHRETVNESETGESERKRQQVY